MININGHEINGHEFELHIADGFSSCVCKKCKYMIYVFYDGKQCIWDGNIYKEISCNELIIKNIIE